MYMYTVDILWYIHGTLMVHVCTCTCTCYCTLFVQTRYTTKIERQKAENERIQALAKVNIMHDCTEVV